LRQGFKAICGPDNKIAAEAMLAHDTGVLSRNDCVWQDGGRCVVDRQTAASMR